MKIVIEPIKGKQSRMTITHGREKQVFEGDLGWLHWDFDIISKIGKFGKLERCQGEWVTCTITFRGLRAKKGRKVVKHV